MLRIVTASLLAFAVTASVQHASAQQYPVKTIRLVAPFAPGGSTDTVARILAPRLAEGLGQNVIVDNRTGAGGTIGADIVAKANPDGYTLMVGDFGPNVVADGLFSKLPYDLTKSFTNIAMAVSFPLVLVSPASSKLNSIKDYVEQARARPGTLRYGSAGIGTSPHIFMEFLQSKANLQVVHVPYKGGAPALGGVLAGEVDCALIAVSTAVAQIGAGKVKALAVTSGSPTARLPGVPSLSTIVPGYDARNFHGLHGPAGLPPAVVKRLADEVNKAVNRPEVRERFDGLAMEVAGTGPQEFDAYIRKQIATWGAFVKAAGIKAD